MFILESNHLALTQLLLFSVFSLTIAASGFFTILYSLEWGKDKSEKWLSTFMLSFFQDVIVVQPVKVFLLVAFISCITKKPELDSEEEMLNELNRSTPAKDEELVSVDKKLSVDDILLQRKKNQELLKPVDLKLLQEIRERRLLEIKMEDILKEIAVYIFFVLVTFFLSYQSRSAESYYMHSNLQNTFITGTNPKFGTITTVGGFWKWANDALLPSLYAEQRYNGDQCLNWRERLRLNDFTTARVGIGRIRQLRVHEDSCNIVSELNSYIEHCRADYNWIDDDAGVYYPGWVKPDSDENRTALKERFNDNNAPNPWVYMSSVKLKNTPYVGEHNTYKGGGFVANLGRTLRGSKEILHRLEKNQWLDMRSRAVFVEFTLYNANVNLFGSVILLVEYLATGGAVTRAEVKIFRLFSYVGGWAIVVILFELVFVGFTIYFIVKESKKLKKQGASYFKDYWNIAEVGNLILCFASIVMYILKHMIVAYSMNALKESGNNIFINFQSLGMYDEMFSLVVALIVFISTLKIIKLLQFNKRMGVLGSTVSYAMKDLKPFFFTFIIYFMAFSSAGYLLFGPVLKSYGTIIAGAEALFAMALGDFDFNAFSDAQRIFGPAFFVTYMCLVYCVLMGMFLTMIDEAFHQVKADVSLQSNDYEVVDFLIGKIKAMFGIQNASMKAREEAMEEDEEEDEKEEKKANEKF